MAQSSNYKQYNRQTRMLTEETAFSGGMMWTGNNINSTHLKTIVNFNYDDTTGFLKTRNPFTVPNLDDYSVSSADKYSEHPVVQYVPSISEGNIVPKEEEEIKQTIPGLASKQLIGAYNMCCTVSTLTEWDTTAIINERPKEVHEHTQSNAGWLYLFGEVSTNEKGYGRCSDSSLVWVYYDAESNWHVFERSFTFIEGALAGSAGVKPILYDNTLYCTCEDDEPCTFYAYRLFKRTELVATNWETVDGQTIVHYTPVDKYYVDKQLYNPDSEQFAKDSLFEDTAKTLMDRTLLLEASVTGFNGLRGSEMYTYTSTTAATDDAPKRISGAYFKDGNTICIAPRLGQAVKLHVILDNVPAAADKGVLKLLRLTQGTVSDVDALWETVATIKVTGEDSFDCIASEEEGTYNIVWYSADAEDATRYDGLIYNYSTNKLNSQLRLKEYNIPSAKGSCLWNSHLVLWDVTGASNCLFISESDNFYYMPVPNNVAVFETDIVSCIPYMGALLVFTADRVYRLVEDNEGAFVQEVVQNNMPLAREDAPYIRAVKNMIFFKSGRYYYMIVPKAQSLTGELSVAPIYKNLAGWFEDPSAATGEILAQLYPENLYTVVDDPTLDAVTVSLPKDIYVEQDTVSILYEVVAQYTTTEPCAVEGARHDRQNTGGAVQKLALFVNYNTNLRAWTMYVEDTTEASLYPAALTAARTMSFVRVTNDDKLYISTMQDATSSNNTVRCLIDTGYRTLANSLKKRFREVQVKLYSATENVTSFGSAFFVDGSVRRNYASLEEVFVTSDTNFVSLAPVYDPNTFILESHMTIDETGNPVFLDSTSDSYKHGSDAVELSDWVLDFSHFKRNAPATIRVPVSGKGYAPRFVFMSPKCTTLHLNEINWVYRVMNGR